MVVLCSCIKSAWLRGMLSCLCVVSLLETERQATISELRVEIETLQAQLRVRKMWQQEIEQKVQPTHDSENHITHNT